MTTPPPDRASAAVWIAAVVAMAVFVPTLGYDYVYDDFRFVQANGALDSPSILWRAFADPVAQTADGSHAGLWRPLRTLSFALDRALFGASPWAGHMVNVLLHGAATALLARLLLRWGCGAFAAAVGALVFALHPAQVECVAWISSRGDLLALVLVFAALHAQMSGRAVAALLCGGAALLAKEQAVVWPAFAVAGALLSGKSQRECLRAAVGPAIVVVAFVGLRHALLESPLQEGGLAGGRPGAGELGLMLGHQTAFTLLPAAPLFDWQMPDVAPGARRLVVVAVGLLPIAALFMKRTRVPALWFLAALVPTLFVQRFINLNIRVADRFLLFALPALAILAAGAAGRRRLRVPALAAVASLLVLTVTALPTWASSEALWGRTAARVSGHWRAESWLGARSLENGDYDAAVSHLHRAALSNARDAKTRFDYALALERKSSTTTGEEATGWAARAGHEFGEALRLSFLPRQEHPDLIQPLARLALLDLAIAMNQRGEAVEGIRTWMAAGPPVVPERGHGNWDRRLANFVEHVSEFVDPELPEPLAPRIAEWGAQR